jgi:hypothetical protein
MNATAHTNRLTDLSRQPHHPLPNPCIKAPLNQRATEVDRLVTGGQPTSGLGQIRTSAVAQTKSALPSKADIPNPTLCESDMTRTAALIFREFRTT